MSDPSHEPCPDWYRYLVTSLPYLVTLDHSMQLLHSVHDDGVALPPTALVILQLRASELNPTTSPEAS